MNDTPSAVYSGTTIAIDDNESQRRFNEARIQEEREISP